MIQTQGGGVISKITKEIKYIVNYSLDSKQRELVDDFLSRHQHVKLLEISEILALVN